MGQYTLCSAETAPTKDVTLKYEGTYSSSNAAALHSHRLVEIWTVKLTQIENVKKT